MIHQGKSNRKTAALFFRLSVCYVGCADEAVEVVPKEKKIGLFTLLKEFIAEEIPEKTKVDAMKLFDDEMKK